MAEQSIAQLFLLGQQRAQQRKEFLQEQEIKQFQLQQLIEDRAIEKEKTSRDYAENLSAILSNPDLPPEELTWRMQKVHASDIPRVWEFRLNALDRKMQRDLATLDAKEQIVAQRLSRGETIPESEMVPLPATVAGPAITAGATTSRQGENLEFKREQEARKADYQQDVLKVRQFQADTSRMLAEQRGRLTDEQIKNMDLRNQQALTRLLTGNLDFNDVQQVMATNMVGAGGQPDAEQMARINQAAQEAWEDAYLEGKNIFDAMREKQVLYEISEEKPSEAARGAMQTNLTKPSRGPIIKPVTGQDLDAQIQAVAGRYATEDDLPTDEQGNVDDQAILREAGIPVTNEMRLKLRAILNSKF